MSCRYILHPSGSWKKVSLPGAFAALLNDMFKISPRGQNQFFARNTNGVQRNFSPIWVPNEMQKHPNILVTGLVFRPFWLCVCPCSQMTDVEVSGGFGGSVVWG